MAVPRFRPGVGLKSTFKREQEPHKLRIATPAICRKERTLKVYIHVRALTRTPTKSLYTESVPEPFLVAAVTSASA